jgi:hypothetical protein
VRSQILGQRPFGTTRRPWHCPVAEAELRAGIPLIGQLTPQPKCFCVVVAPICSLAVLKRPCDCRADQRERENAAGNESCDLLFHDAPGFQSRPIPCVTSAFTHAPSSAPRRSVRASMITPPAARQSRVLRPDRAGGGANPRRPHRADSQPHIAGRSRRILFLSAKLLLFGATIFARGITGAKAFASHPARSCPVFSGRASRAPYSERSHCL